MLGDLTLDSHHLLLQESSSWYSQSPRFSRVLNCTSYTIWSSSSFDSNCTAEWFGWDGEGEALLFDISAWQWAIRRNDLSPVLPCLLRGGASRWVTSATSSPLHSRRGIRSIPMLSLRLFSSSYFGLPCGMNKILDAGRMSRRSSF